jgi:polysaccharide biosynthesis transport protein
LPELKAFPETESNIGETIATVLRVLKTRRLLILGLAALFAVLTAAVLPLIPTKYKSEALILVVKQEVPERYVTPTSTTEIGEELQAMTEEVLSRTRLMGIIDDLHLFSKERQTAAPEEIVEKMRRRIDITPLTTPDRKGFSAFKIAYAAQDPQTAQDVTGRLTSLFIEDNLKTRQDQATNTAAFLSSQLDAVKAKLDDQEARLRDYKMQHLGELPEQQQGNLAILGTLQAQLQNTASSRGRAEQQRVYLESLLNDYRNYISRGLSVPAAAGGSHIANPLEEARAELKRLQASREQLLEVDTPQHPEVLRIDAQIARKQKVVDSLKPKEAPATPGGAAPAALTGTEDNPQTSQLKSQLEANRIELENLSKDEKKLKAQLAEYQQRINSTPVREQQLADVVRDYELLKLNYADLLSKKQQSQLAASLEKQQEGQHFRVIDPPSLPKVAAGPKPIVISAGGAAAGLLLGLGLAFLFEMRRSAFWSEKEIMRSFGLVLVLDLPVIPTARERRSNNWRSVLGAVASVFLVLVICAAQYYVYKRG